MNVTIYKILRKSKKDSKWVCNCVYGDTSILWIYELRNKSKNVLIPKFNILKRYTFNIFGMKLIQIKIFNFIIQLSYDSKVKDIPTNIDLDNDDLLDIPNANDKYTYNGKTYILY